MNGFQNEKKFILAISAAGGVIMICIVLLSLLSRSQQKQQLFPSPTLSAPTVFPENQAFSKRIEIVSLDPENNATNISITPTIVVIFSRPLSPEEHSHVSLIASPTASLRASWSADGSIAYFSVSKSLQTSQTYSLTLLYGSLSRVWVFTTKSGDNLTNQDFQNIQTVADDAYAKHQQDINTLYPWISSLPLSSPKYFTHFDLDTKSFSTDMYYTKKSPLTSSQQKEIQQQVLSALQNLGVNTTNYKFVWQPTLVSE